MGNTKTENDVDVYRYYHSNTLRVTFDRDACALKVLEIYILFHSFVKIYLLEKEKLYNETLNSKQIHSARTISVFGYIEKSPDFPQVMLIPDIR